MSDLACGYFAQCVEDAGHEGPHRASDFGASPEWTVPTMEPAAFDHPAVAVKAAAIDAMRYERAEAREPEATLDVDVLRELRAYVIGQGIRGGPPMEVVGRIAAEIDRLAAARPEADHD